MSFAERVMGLRFEGAYTVQDRAQRLEAEGREIIHLEIGQPDFPTFPRVALAGIRAIAEGKTRYTSPGGLAALREAIAKDLGARRGLSVDPKEVLVAPGAKPFLFFPALALLEPGDEVLYPDPGFPSYQAAIEIARGSPVPFPLREEGTFTPDVDALERLVSGRTRLIVLNSPGNPTGGVMPGEALERVAAVARSHDCYVLSDEIYSRLIFSDGPHVSIASLPGMQERTIILDGFSKTYGMTGWRLGYAAMPPALAERVELLLTHVVGSTATFTQHAGLEALVGPQEDAEAARQEFERRRDLIVDRLRRIPGITCQKPDGAMYVFPNVKAFGRSSDELAEYLLSEAGVAVLPGNVFGKRRGGLPPPVLRQLAPEDRTRRRANGGRPWPGSASEGLSKWPWPPRAGAGAGGAYRLLLARPGASPCRAPSDVDLFHRVLHPVPRSLADRCSGSARRADAAGPDRAGQTAAPTARAGRGRWSRGGSRSEPGRRGGCASSLSGTKRGRGSGTPRRS